MAQREKISENFYLDEFTDSATAKAKGILNVPTEDQVAALKYVVVKIVQPTRSHFKRPLTINSGFRSSKLNVAVGGVATSQHCYGEAVDLEVPGVPNKDVAEWIAGNCPFDQIILEFYNPAEGPNSGWVHVSLKRDGKNRRNRLVAYKDGKTTRYEAVADFSKIK